MKGITCCLIVIVLAAQTGFSQATCDERLDNISSPYYSLERIKGYPAATTPVSVSSLKQGAIVVYKTNEGRFGIFEITVNHNCQTENCSFEINWITYNNDQSIRSKGCDLVVASSYDFDLDNGTAGVPGDGNDFWYHNVDNEITFLQPTPKSGTSFFVVRSFVIDNFCSDNMIKFQPPKKTIPTNYTIENDGTLLVQQSGLVMDNQFAWSPGDVINVGFENSIKPPNRVYDGIVRYSKIWEEYANIKFNFVDDVNKAVVIIGFTKDGLSWSAIGRQALINEGPLNVKTMNFAGEMSDGIKDYRYVRGVILHEFGHALGFAHEHQHPESGIEWNVPLVYQYFESAGVSRSIIDNNILGRYSKSTTNFSAYDPLSIMHYDIPPELILNGKPGNRNYNLSATDIRYAALWYPFPNKQSAVLRTGDDCDEINFSMFYNNYIEPDEVVISVFLDEDHVTWWKSIVIPLKNGSEKVIEIEKSKYGQHSIRMKVSEIDYSRPFGFQKAKVFGKKTRLGFTWPSTRAIKGRTTVEFKWVKDHCG